ncbi:MAG: SCP-2 sterol transfer family protein [Methylococcales bacterium]|jgi:hypothetical protein|nr:SCP-2 sterol transfer family protein [Methylococcales bacterium]
MILFDGDWMAKYMEVWNNATEVSDALAEINFTSTIGCGMPDEDNPRGILVVENGKAISGAPYEGQEMNWDLRAAEKHWLKWQDKGIGMAGLGMAVTTGKLKFRVGDYGAMIKNPKMAGPFVKSFGLMGQVK